MTVTRQSLLIFKQLIRLDIQGLCDGEDQVQGSGSNAVFDPAEMDAVDIHHFRQHFLRQFAAFTIESDILAKIDIF